MTLEGNWLTKAAPEKAAEIERDRVIAYEATLVKRIMANAGVSAGELRMQVNPDDYPGLTMHWLWEQTKFPVLLGAAKIPWMQHLQIGELFGPNFVKTRFFAAYVEFITSECFDDREHHCGLVFNWPGIPQGGNAMVLHNYPIDSCALDPALRTERGTRIVRPYGAPLVIYVIESFHDFLLSVGTNWFEGF